MRLPWCASWPLPANWTDRIDAMTARFLALLALTVLPAAIACADTPAQRCQDLLESGMRMAGWEQRCRFNAGVAHALRAGYVQAGCPALIQDGMVDQTVRRLDAELDAQIRHAGNQAAFCRAARPAYDDIVSAMPRAR